MRLARSAFPQAAAYSRILSQKCLFSHLWVSVVAFEPKQSERRWKEEGLKDWRGNAKLFRKVISGGVFFFVVVVLFLIMCWHNHKITGVCSELYLVILCVWIFCLFLLIYLVVVVVWARWKCIWATQQKPWLVPDSSLQQHLPVPYPVSFASGS